MAKKISAASKIQELLKGGKKNAPAKTEKKGKSTHQGAVYEKKGGNGGARENSGRETLAAVDQKRSLKGSYREFANEEVEMAIDATGNFVGLEKGNVTQRRVKMARLKMVQEIIFKHALLGNMVAAKELNDRALGKSPQPLIGDIEEDPIQVNHDVSPILEKAYGTDDNDEEEG